MPKNYYPIPINDNLVLELNNKSSTESNDQTAPPQYPGKHSAALIECIEFSCPILVFVKSLKYHYDINVFPLIIRIFSVVFM